MPADAELISHEISKSGIKFESVLVETKKDYKAALKSFLPDLIVSDYALPQFDGMAALCFRNEHYPSIPFILVTGSINEEVAVECMKAGADDYVIKQNLSRLVPAIETALSRKKIIKEKEIAESMLKESEERFRMLFDKAPIGYQSLNIDGDLLEINETWLEMFGYSRQEVIGKWFGDFLSPEFKDAFRERFPLFKERGKIHSEFGMVKKNGSVMTIAFDGRIGHSLDGEFMQTHCVLEDVSELRQTENTLRESEERFHLAVENSPVPIMIHDENDKILILSKGWVDISGYTVDDIPTMADWTEKAYGERSGSKKDYIDSLFEINATTDNGEWTIRTKGRKESDMGVSYNPLGRVSQGNRVLQSIAIDITGWKNAEKALNQKIEELEKFNDLTVDREMKMIELKKEINDILRQNGKEVKYKIVE